jgi:hypothetical protein
MKLLEVVYQLSDRLRLGGYSLSGSNKITQCPDESELLAYAEKRLSPKRRAVLEAHMADCDDCRESLVLFARISGEGIENVEALDMSTSGDLVHRQTEKIFSLIARDEAEQTASGIRQQRLKEERVKPERSGFFASYAQLAFAATLVIVAAVAIGYLMTDQRKALDEGKRAVAVAIGETRGINPRISGGFGDSPNPVTRGPVTHGDRKNGELQFDIAINNAINKLKFAEEESASAEARMALAGAYLSRDKPGDAKLALDILNSISNTPDASPELLNDTGVAWYQLGDFRKAIEAFSKAIEKKPYLQEAWFNRALANVGAGFNNAARKDFQEFISITNDEKWKQEAEERLNKLPLP